MTCISTNDEHWVTVTGTVDGKPATSFDDLVGVDPWYNGNNTAHGGSVGIGGDACNASKSGVISLNKTCLGFMETTGDKFPDGYRIVTFNVD